MNLGKIFFAVVVVGILIMAGLQVYGSVYSPDKSFNAQVENHLISTVQMKGERINDYFLERKHDILVLADSVEVRELLQSEVGSDEIVIGKNVEEGLRVIARQVEIYAQKYPDVSFEGWQDDEEFQAVVARGIGETGESVLVDYDSFDKRMFDYYESANVKTSDGISLGVAAKVNLDEFKILSAGNAKDNSTKNTKDDSTENATDDSSESSGEPSGEPKNATLDLINSMERFKEISDYEDLILIDSDGYVVYQVEYGLELGTNLGFVAYSSSPLGEAYSEVMVSKKAVVYGPYLEIGAPELVLLFMAHVYDEGEFIGVIVLQDSMSDVNNISMESAGLGETGDSYVVDEDRFLVTPLRQRDLNLLVQEVDSENSQKCFKEQSSSSRKSKVERSSSDMTLVSPRKSGTGGQGELISYFDDFKGDSVIGSYAYIEEVEWCLVAEIEEREVFEAPKEGVVRQDLIFIFSLNFILLIIGFILKRKMEGKRK